MAVRAALGAGRAARRSGLTESVLLGLAGGAAGLAVAYWAIGLLRRLMPAGLPVLGLQHLALDRARAAVHLPDLDPHRPPVRVAAGVAHRSEDVNESLKEGGRSPGNVRRRLRTALVIGEIALASLLLVGAGLTLRSFQRLLHAEAGFETRRPYYRVGHAAGPQVRRRSDETGSAR